MFFRLEMWGPTQFISDILAEFVSCPSSNFISYLMHPFPSQFEKMSVYETFLNAYPSTIVTIDSLYIKSSTFSKFIDVSVDINDTNLQILITILELRFTSK